MPSSASTLPEGLLAKCGAATFRARYEIRSWCGCSDRVFAALHGQKRFNRQQLVRRTTELCVEGFPRSANSYTVLRLASAQTRQLKLSHHLHVPAQVQRAARWKIPMLVLIRNPRDAAASLLIRHPELTPGQVLRAYTLFYQAVLPLREHFVLGAFEEVTRDLGSVITAVNSRFGTTFVPPQPEPTVDARVFRLLDGINQSQGTARGEHAVSRPSVERAARKAVILRRLIDGRVIRTLMRAEAIYEKTLVQCGGGDANSTSGRPSRAA